MPGELVPITIFGGLFIFLFARVYYRYKLHATALEKGIALPETPKDKGDLRKPALVLITLGLGYSISMYTTLSMVDDHDAPALAVSIWGIVPMLVGAGLWFYRQITEKERLLKERLLEEGRTPPLT